MFKKVIVGFDGEAGGRDAIALARQLVAPNGELIEAHVRLLYPAKFDMFPDEKWSYPGDASGDRHAPDPDVKVRHIVATGIGRGLHVLAEGEGADLLVVGSSRHGSFGRVLLGDNAREAINGAPCAVAVAPAGYAEHEHPLNTIGVAYNASPESEQALAVARSIAAEHKAALSAMEVANFPTYAYLGGAGIPFAEVIAPLLDDARKRVQSLAGVDPHATFGEPPEELANYSSDVDLLVVGSRGYGPVGRLVHSSTSRHLARTCRCPLLILTRDAHEPEYDDAADTQSASVAGA